MDSAENTGRQFDGGMGAYSNDEGIYGRMKALIGQKHENIVKDLGLVDTGKLPDS